MIHLDLFSGIGGFAYAADQVWGNVEHIFCDNDKFCQQVLKKHWPESEIYDDIRAITNTRRKHGSERGTESSHGEKAKRSATTEVNKRFGSIDLLTGGFPCQPFSQAGARRGTADDRYLWPEMLRVIRLTKPTWVIAENVRGLLTLEQGVVFEQVCTDLEAEGYAVQPFIIPAVSVNAPHRRDRVWFVAHANGNQLNSEKRQSTPKEKPETLKDTSQDDPSRQSARTDKRLSSNGKPDRYDTTAPDWSKDWLEVATWSSRVDNGLPDRAHRLKALGNSIVPQIAIEIMKGMKV